MYYDQIKLLKQGVEKARGLLGDAIDVVPVLGTVNQGLLAAENIGRGNLAGAAENIQNLVPIGKIAGRAIKALTKGKGQSELGGLLNIDVWHGSPHKYDRIDTSKIGTGEGAQAYGHGFYAAEAKRTAQEYRDKLSSDAPARRALQAYGGDFGAAIANAQSKVNNYKSLLESGESGDNRRAQGMLSIAEKNLNDLKKIQAGEDTSGYLYKMDLPDQKVAQMLDWDVPLAQQPKSVQDAFAKALQDNRLEDYTKTVIGNGGTGGAIHNVLSVDERLGNPAAVSEYLRSLGIPGIAYKDSGSRNSEGGTRNFVVFPGEAEELKILERNGQALGIQGGLLDSTADSSLMNRYQAPQDEALALAQKRAALPVSEGGLGLPPDNTPMDRAKAMGYVDRVYHGTDKDFGSFDPAMSRQDVQYMPGIFTADSPDMSAAYGDRIIPLLQKRGTTVMDKREARRSGAEIPVVDTIYDKQKGIRVTNDPSNLRSVFAAFDPFRRNESDLLALQGVQYTPQDLLGFERMMGLLGE